MKYTLLEALQKTSSRTLTSVEFVWDYVQIKFDDYVLTAITHPTIGKGGKFYNWQENNYKNILCEIIGNTLDSVSLNDDKLCLFFSNLSTICISLLPEDYIGPEALEFRSDQGIWVV